MAIVTHIEKLLELETNRAGEGADLTVTISLFNYESYIEECLDSILQQTLPCLSLIVVDDCSTDESVAVTKSWLERNSEHFKRVLLVKHARNRGLAEARNTGFRNAKTNFVFVLDADNILYPRCLESLADAISCGNYGAAYPQIERFGDISALGWSDVWSPDLFKKANYVDAMSLVSVAAWKKVGEYTLMSGWEDYDFWCKFVDHGIEAVFVPEVLCRYRVHATSMLRTETKQHHESVAIRMLLRHPWLELDVESI